LTAANGNGSVDERVVSKRTWTIDRNDLEWLWRDEGQVRVAMDDEYQRDLIINKLT